MRRFAFAMAMLAGLSTTAAYADGQTVGPAKVIELKVDAGHVGMILNTGFTDNQCGQGTIYHVMLYPSDPGFLELYTSILAAINSDKSLKFWVEGCSSATVNFWGTRWPLVKSMNVLYPQPTP